VLELELWTGLFMNRAASLPVPAPIAVQLCQQWCPHLLINGGKLLPSLGCRGAAAFSFNQGQLGNNSTDQTFGGSTVPVAVSAPLGEAAPFKWFRIYAGAEKTCAIQDGTRRAYCWGACVVWRRLYGKWEVGCGWRGRCAGMRLCLASELARMDGGRVEVSGWTRGACKRCWLRSLLGSRPGQARLGLAGPACLPCSPT